MATAIPLMSSAPDADPVLAAAQRAPLVEATDEERALMEEIEGRPIRWTSNDQFMSKLGNEPR
jgi:hypothetical protein